MVAPPGHRHFAILGPFRSRSDGDWVEAPSPQASRVGATLAAFAGQTLSVSRIADLVWDGDAPTTAASAVRVYISQLRRQWGEDSIIVSRDGYALDAPREAVDAYRFLAMATRAKELVRRGHLRRAGEALWTAAQLWRGTPALAARDVEWQAMLALLLETRTSVDYLIALCRLELSEDSFAISEVIAEARRIAVRYSQDEQAQLLLARALCLGGRRNEAFTVVDDFVVASDLPESAALTQFRSRMERQDESLAPAISRSLRAIAEPAELDPRDEVVVAEARRMLIDESAHAVSVIAPDVRSHSRLVAELAHELRGDFLGGQVLLGAGEGTLVALDEAVAAASRGRVRSAQSLDDPTTLLVAMTSDDASDVRALLNDMAGVMRAPRLVVVSSHSLGVPHEVAAPDNA